MSCVFIDDAAAIPCPWSAAAAHLSSVEVDAVCHVVCAYGSEHREHALYDGVVQFGEVPAAAEEDVRLGRHKLGPSTTGGHAVDWHLLHIAWCVLRDGSEAADIRRTLAGRARRTSLWWCADRAAAQGRWTPACGSDVHAVCKVSRAR